MFQLETVPNIALTKLQRTRPIAFRDAFMLTCALVQNHLKFKRQIVENSRTFHQSFLT